MVKEVRIICWYSRVAGLRLGSVNLSSTTNGRKTVDSKTLSAEEEPSPFYLNDTQAPPISCSSPEWHGGSNSVVDTQSNMKRSPRLPLWRRASGPVIDDQVS